MMMMIVISDWLIHWEERATILIHLLAYV